MVEARAKAEATGDRAGRDGAGLRLSEWLLVVARRHQQAGRPRLRPHSAVGTRCMMAAHRFIYELLIGPVPAGMQLDHTCENTLCVSPHHLEPVTNDENQRRKWARNGGAGAFEAYQQQCDDERQQLAGRSIEDDLVDAFD
jgi:hypothetical protein